jgi:hypothetical protein
METSLKPALCISHLQKPCTGRESPRSAVLRHDAPNGDAARRPLPYTRVSA